ncbi:MAG: hypothetical protein E6Q34_03765 [Burkholderiaceae bacterium]|nr:MAG: hypothetical protein E6Q34_03765 [Burkholderiaceae bacterium]HND04044.1 hypothetical protein [Candidatus Obscuribacter sp.]HND04055.1 hypothetical protein [Candidatus Obscuribacter sp.]
MFLPKILASLLALSPQNSPAPAVEDNDQEKLKQHYQTYLEFRNKQEKLRSDSRAEIDKTMMTLSGQAIVITVALCPLLKGHPGPYLYWAWGCFVSVILITLLSMAISELLADYNIEVIDRALEAAKEAKPVPDELPFYPEIEKEKSKLKKFLLQRQAPIIFILNLVQFACFVVALILVITWGAQTTPMASESEQAKEIVNYGQKPSTLPKPLPTPLPQQSQTTNSSSSSNTQPASDKKR